MQALFLLLAVRLGLGFVFPRLSRQDVVLSGASTMAAAAEQARRANLNALPVFESLDHPFMIPFERSLTTYRLEQPSHKRLIQAAVNAAKQKEAGEEGSNPPQFFHVVDKPWGATVGAVGCIGIIRSIEFESYEGVQKKKADDEAAMLVSVASGGRGVVVAEHATVYTSRDCLGVTVSVVPLNDVDENFEDDYEREAWRRLVSIASLTSFIESTGDAAHDAEESLLKLEEELAEFQEATLEYNWPVNERRERSGFLLLGLCALDHEASTEALLTTSGRRRFELLLDFLRPTEAELAAYLALESLAASESLQADDILLQPGTKFNYFWNNDDGWFDGIIVENMQPTAGWYTVRWDSDDTVTRLPLEDENKSRWRVIS